MREPQSDAPPTRRTVTYSEVLRRPAVHCAPIETRVPTYKRHAVRPMCRSGTQCTSCGREKAPEKRCMTRTSTSCFHCGEADLRPASSSTVLTIPYSPPLAQLKNRETEEDDLWRRARWRSDM
ncbi:hypothetical protein HPB52_002136 [Rhipicephalus sanguineus]|uniref:Uncharacterized protein n=1 Tax=Rhipicephalus sanguineus TaxID=34632 RepID=A0A9D4PQF8_RHISA|nr:hypothetical protein HPB52_002136 [Rhipicephalus sanguineus]